MDAHELQRIRATPLESVLEGFGAQRDPKDPKRNWKLADSRITVTGDKFFDHNAEKGGGGALDLTLHLMGRDFKQASAADFRAATKWLGAVNQAMANASERVAQNPVRPFDESASKPQQPPVPDASHLARVRWYLSEQRAVPASLVDRAIGKGLIFADDKANVVFRLRDETLNEVGYEKRGTYDKPYHGVVGSKGLFFIGSGQSKVAAFVESGIEALSYKALNPTALVISTTGNAIELPEKMGRVLLDRGFKVLAAFNADLDGDRFAQRFAERLDRAVTRDRPNEQVGKDWNLVLRAQRDAVAFDRQDHVALTR